MAGLQFIYSKMFKFGAGDGVKKKKKKMFKFMVT